MQFTAIDFETANRRSDSACQLAAVVVEAGRIVDQRCWLIRPRPFYFSGFNIQIHGIRPEDVEQEPEFADLWPEIHAFLGDRCLVAHNAAFDIKVLTACLKTHRLTLPELRFTCTRLIAKQTWPQWGRFGLKPVSDRLGIRFQHHDALEDSLACAKVLLAASIKRQCGSLEALEQTLRIERGQCGPLGYRGARLARGRTRRPTSTTSQPAASGRGARSRSAVAVGEATAIEPPQAGALVDVHRLLLRAEMVRSLAGKRVCVSGSFRSLSRDQVTALVTALGGQPLPASESPADICIQGLDDSPPNNPQATAQADVTWSEQQFLEQLVSESRFC
ncbi:exonuclease domain-containing protein [Roseimaritima ulvae]|uniref:DNA polymerase III PolC-type n=1 Tax=Roseimaritima ulvae TaxID=980254 RepID=A0A5B9QKE4_9BACT|nr:exonuclease domain-containing protein [Roseimaritima ulvae]QEG38060.1 DNA polymerase III PolC-type [Roseimaritima ulvae]